MCTVQLVLLAALLLMPAFGLLPFLVPLRPLGLLVGFAGLVLSGVATWQLQAGRSLTQCLRPAREPRCSPPSSASARLYAPLGLSNCGKGDKDGGCCGGGKCG
jgi:hypothetical protein